MKKNLTFLIIAILINNSEVLADILFQDNFDAYNDTPSNHGWSAGTAVSLVQNEGWNNSNCVKIVYTNSGTAPYVFSWSGISNLNKNKIYIRFYYKTSVNQGGMKFCKLFGKDTGYNYANTTIPLEQNDGKLDYIRYGDGGGLTNDTQDYINLTSGAITDSSVVVQTYGKEVVPDNTWHCVEFYMKYNSNNNRDGEYKLWLDGVLILHATNVKNRHNDNTPEFSRIGFGDYTATSTGTRYIYYDNIVFSDEYIGPLQNEQDPLGMPYNLRIDN
jgi:hypothetical protein